MNKGQYRIVRIFQSKIILAFLIIITIFSGLRLTKEVVRKNKINEEISNLKQQISTLQNEQRSLSALIDYLDTDAYIEEQARKKLNLLKPGESVVVVSDGNNQISSSVRLAQRSTIEQWWNYFFNENEKK